MFGEHSRVKLLRGHSPHIAHGRETLQMHGFPMQTFGKLQIAIRGVNRNLALLSMLMLLCMPI